MFWVQDDLVLQTRRCHRLCRLLRARHRHSWWKWRKVYGFPWKHRGEHINVLGLRAVINGVLLRLRSAANIHSKGVQATDSMVILGALAKRRSAPRRLAPLVLKFNSLVVAASFTPLLVYCQTGLYPADEPSRHTAPLERRAGSDCERPFDCTSDRRQRSSLDCAFFNFTSAQGLPNHTQLPKWISAFVN